MSGWAHCLSTVTVSPSRSGCSREVSPWYHYSGDVAAAPRIQSTKSLKDLIKKKRDFSHPGRSGWKKELQLPTRCEIRVRWDQEGGLMWNWMIEGKRGGGGWERVSPSPACSDLSAALGWNSWSSLVSARLNKSETSHTEKQSTKQFRWKQNVDFSDAFKGQAICFWRVKVIFPIVIKYTVLFLRCFHTWMSEPRFKFYPVSFGPVIITIRHVI